MTFSLDSKKPGGGQFMNLRKDALVAVVLAGAVLATVALTTKAGRDEPKAKISQMQVVQDHDLSVLFAETERQKAISDPEHAEEWLRTARLKALEIYNSGRLKGSMDFFRLARILETSTNPSELALSHRLAMEALSAGFESARGVVFRSQDRLLLSIGEEQRYGTQTYWNGQKLESKGIISPDLPTSVRSVIGVQQKPKPVMTQ